MRDERGRLILGDVIPAGIDGEPVHNSGDLACSPPQSNASPATASRLTILRQWPGAGTCASRSNRRKEE
jgi:hypothetical protein